LPQKLKFRTDVRFWHVVTSHHYAALHAGGVTARGVAAAAAATRNFGMRRFAILGKVNNEL
jgi:hypothetical protein